MNTLFVLLFLLSLILLPVVLIKPELLEKITKHPFTRLKAGLLVGGVVFVLFILIGVTAKPLVKTVNKPKVEETPQQKIPAPTLKPTEPIKDTSELNASVRQVFVEPKGIEVINNEKSTWYGCEFVLNSSYKKQYRDDQGISSGPSEALTIPYGLFTKSDGTRFNYAATAPKTLLIECKVNGNSRNNVYEF